METTKLVQFYFMAKWFNLKRHKVLHLAEDFAAYAVEQHLKNPKRRLLLRTLEIDYYRSIKGSGRNIKKLPQVKNVKRVHEKKFAAELPTIQDYTPEDSCADREHVQLIKDTCLNDTEFEIARMIIVDEKTIQEATEILGIKTFDGWFAMHEFIKRYRAKLAALMLLFLMACTTPKKCIEQKDDPSLSVDERAAIVSECYYEK